MSKILGIAKVVKASEEGLNDGEEGELELMFSFELIANMKQHLNMDEDDFLMFYVNDMNEVIITNTNHPPK